MFDNTLIFDSLELTGDSQHAGAITSTRISDKVIEQVVNSSDYSKMWLSVIVKEAFATLTSLTVELIEADNDALTTNAKTLFSKTLLAAELAKVGEEVVKVRLPLPEKKVGNSDGHIFLGLKYTVNGSNATAGKVVAGLTDAVNTSAD